MRHIIFKSKNKRFVFLQNGNDICSSDLKGIRRISYYYRILYCFYTTSNNTIVYFNIMAAITTDERMNDDDETAQVSTDTA